MSGLPLRLLAAALAAALAAGCADSPGGSAGPAASATGAESLLFVQTADEARFLPIEGAPGLYTLELAGLDPSALYFAERPDRSAGTMAHADLMSEAFAGAEPPNAAVVGSPSRGEPDVAIPVELDSPALTLAGMTYSARLLDGFSDGLAFVDARAAAVPETLQDVEVFIDSAEYSRCVASLTNHTESTFYLDTGNMDPALGNVHWTNVVQTIYPGQSISTDLRFKDSVTDTRRHHGTLPYFTSPSGGDGLGLVLVCTVGTGHGVVSDEATKCSYDEFGAPFTCTLSYSSDMHTVKFNVVAR